MNPIAWLRDMRLMLALARKAPPPIPGAKRPRILVVVMPWLGTAVPWFSIVFGLLLGTRGNRVSFVIDDLPFGRHFIRRGFVLWCVRSVLKVVSRHYRVLALSGLGRGRSPNEAQREAVQRLADLNAVWALRGETDGAGRRRYIALIGVQLGTTCAAIDSLLSSEPYEAILVPGGIYGSSGMWVDQAHRLGVRTATFDSGGRGVLMLAANGVACQLRDIPRAFALLKSQPLTDREEALIARTAMKEIELRRAGTDRFASQLQATRPVDSSYDGAVLIALNSSWDSAALGLHAVFSSSISWVLETVRFLLATTTARVIVRQHPAERLEAARSNDNYRELLSGEFGNHPQLQFIAAEDPVNTYDLMEHISVVVVHTSTIGIEAAAHGKLVVTAANAYYSDLGFVLKAKDQDQYQQILRDAVRGVYSVTPQMRRDALWCYYLTQCCNWVVTPFSPEGFADWSHSDLITLAEHKDVRQTLDCVQEDIPVAYLNHMSRLAAVTEQ